MVSGYGCTRSSPAGYRCTVQQYLNNNDTYKSHYSVQYYTHTHTRAHTHI